MQESPGIFVHLDLCGDWLGPEGQSAFIALPFSAETATKECEQHIGLYAASSTESPPFSAG
jgi:hypothetical protein